MSKHGGSSTTCSEASPWPYFFGPRSCPYGGGSLGTVVARQKSWDSSASRGAWRFILLVHLAWVGEDEGEEPDNDPSLPDTPSLFGDLDMEEGRWQLRRWRTWRRRSSRRWWQRVGWRKGKLRRWTNFFLLKRPDRFKLEPTHGQAKNLVADTQTKRACANGRERSVWGARLPPAKHGSSPGWSAVRRQVVRGD